MRIFIIILILACAAGAAYEVQPYSISDSMQISTSGLTTSGTYTLYGSITVGSPGISTGGGFSLNTGFLHSESGCTVKFRDLKNLADAWLLSSPSAGDLNSDSSVNELDYAILAKYWLNNCPPGWPLK
jgi:hypothetical protein